MILSIKLKYDYTARVGVERTFKSEIAKRRSGLRQISMQTVQVEATIASSFFLQAGLSCRLQKFELLFHTISRMFRRRNGKTVVLSFLFCSV